MKEKLNIMACPVCNNISYECLHKDFATYFQCEACGTLFCGALDNADKIGGGFEVERNINHNAQRIERIEEIFLSLGVDKESGKILDFGCGNGLLISDFKKEGYYCDGFDAYNEKYMGLPEHDKYNVVTAIEVIEHTSKPYSEIDVMRRSLKKHGVVMIETSFVDVAEDEGIELEDFHYISPDAGHSTIFSHHGLDLIMALKGFIPIKHFDRHVRCYKNNDKN